MRLKNPISPEVILLGMDDPMLLQFMAIFLPGTKRADYEELFNAFFALTDYALKPAMAASYTARTNATKRFDLGFLYSKYPDKVLDFLQCARGFTKPKFTGKRVQRFLVKYFLDQQSTGKALKEPTDGELALRFEESTGEKVTIDTIKKVRQSLSRASSVNNTMSWRILSTIGPANASLQKQQAHFLAKFIPAAGLDSPAYLASIPHLLNEREKGR